MTYKITRHQQATHLSGRTSGSAGWEGLCTLIRAFRDALGYVLLLSPLIGLLLLAAANI